MYKGKEKCQGCGKSGEEVNRYSKDELCETCKAALKLGLATDFENKIEHAFIFQHYHAFRSDVVNVMIHKILKSMDNPNAKVSGGLENIKHSSGSNGKYYTIDKRFVAPLKELFTEIENKFNELENELSNVPKLVAKQMDLERDIIYNDGLEKGRNLLMQLNLGTITLDDLHKNRSYRERNKS